MGRYVLHERVGVGGMGMVYAAHDPELDRRVAVKLLLTSQLLDDPDGRSSGQRRLVREAQAMARLTHPNVVTVHDVGVHDDEVFVAMEFVEGGTVGRWRATPRSLDEIVAVFTAAARGLQAAHDAGLVHRDFKPDNVMLTADGEVRVMDFGLARRTGGDAPVPAATEATLPTLEDTQTQGHAGTPAYMAPEQHAGLPITPKTDQFSFCVALYEALYGERPFCGDNVPALAFEVLEGHVQPAPRGARLRVPPRLRAVLLRGMSVDPDDRWPSMRALSAALQPPRSRTRWAIAAVGAAAAAAWIGLASTPNDARCEGSASHMAEVWGDTHRAGVIAGLSAHDAPWTEDMIGAVTRGLDAYADDWVRTGEGLCAQADDGAVSPRVLDLGMACLQRRRNAMVGLVESLQQADAELAERAATSVARLRPVHSCGDVGALLAEVAPPDDPKRAEQVEAIRSELAAAEAIVEAGRVGTAEELLRALVDRSIATGYEPVHVEASAVLGRALSRSGQADEARRVLDAAFWRASALKHERVAAEIAVDQLRVLGVVQGDFAAAEAWQRQAQTAVARAGADTGVAASFEVTVADIAKTRGDTDAAMASLQRALKIRRALHRPGHPEIEQVRQNMGAVMIAQGRYDEAAEALTAMLASVGDRVGSRHPAVARVAANLGAAEIKRGHYAAAERQLSRAADLLQELELPSESGRALSNLAIAQRRRGSLDAAAATAKRAVEAMRQAHGDRHVRYATALSGLASVQAQRGEFAKTIELHEESLSIREHALGPDHHDLSYPLAGIAAALMAQGRTEEAVPYYERIVEVLASLPEDHPRLGRALSNLAGAVFELGRPDEAWPLLSRALEIAERRNGPSSQRVANVLTLMARVAAVRGQGDDAVARATRALSILEAEGEPSRKLDARFSAAQGRWARNDEGDRAAARAEARAVAEGFEALGPGFARPAAEVRAWLEARPQ